MYFYDINISDNQDNLKYIEITSTTSNTALVDLQEVPELQGYFSFTLKTNTTVYLSLEVWDHDSGSGTNDFIRDIDNLVIPFNEITKSNVWTVKRFTLSDGAYLEIQYKISDCYSTTGLGCNFCIENYYTSLCDKYCLPVQGSYTCSTSGDKVCVEHKTGENCDMCQKEWSGEQCEECAENYFPEKVCDVTCIAVEGRYTCSNIGKKVCDENWAGVECDSCAEHRTGDSCEKCSEGWGGNKCQECDKDYYPEGVCNEKCTAVDGRYTCSNLGKKVCNENWKGLECDSCAEHRTGETCEQCSEGWGGNKCQECDKDYYPEGVCNVRCTEEMNKFTCKEDGSKDCYKNWKGEECDNCSKGYFGQFCDLFCKETGHYNCSSTGGKVCLDNTTTVANNCQKFKKNIWVNIGTPTVAVVSTITAVVMIIYVIVLRKRLKEYEQNLARRSNKIANADC